ncbi:hypothetical protein BOX15_Mlig017237g1, partial [Macrostomum lignano]
GAEKLQLQPTPPLPSPSPLELSGKRVFFFYEPAGTRRDRQCEAGVQLCGGIVEPFFSKQVDCLITNADLSNKPVAEVLGFGAVAASTPPPRVHGASSRGLLLQRLAAAAKGVADPAAAIIHQASTAAAAGDDTLAKARSLGLRIFKLTDVRDCLRASGHLPPEPADAAGAATGAAASSASVTPQFYSGDRVLSLPALVIADPRRQRGPIVSEKLDVVDCFNAAAGSVKENRRPPKIVSPCRGRQRRRNPEPPPPTQPPPQKRRCENCHGAYLDFNSHVTGPRHRQFVATPANFVEIDKVLSDLTPLAEALAVAVPAPAAPAAADAADTAAAEAAVAVPDEATSAKLVADLNWLAASPRAAGKQRSNSAAAVASQCRGRSHSQDIRFLTGRRVSAGAATAAAPLSSRRQLIPKQHRKSAPQVLLPTVVQKTGGDAAVAMVDNASAADPQQPRAKRPRLDAEAGQQLKSSGAAVSEATEHMAMSNCDLPEFKYPSTASFGRLSRQSDEAAAPVGQRVEAAASSSLDNDVTVPMSDPAWSDPTDPLQQQQLSASRSASSQAGRSNAATAASGVNSSNDNCGLSSPSACHRRHKRQLS